MRHHLLRMKSVANLMEKKDPPREKALDGLESSTTKKCMQLVCGRSPRF